MVMSDVAAINGVYILETVVKELKQIFASWRKKVIMRKGGTIVEKFITEGVKFL